MKNQLNKKQRYFPVRLNPNDTHDVTLRPVSEEEYFDLYRPVWRKRKQMQKTGQCRCPQKFLWRCDGQCDICKYRAAGIELSYERDLMTNGDHYEAPGADPADIYADREILRLLLKRLEELCPEALEVGDLMTDGNGISQRDALERLGLKRSTYRSRLQKAKEQLCREFGVGDIRDLYKKN